MPKIAEVSIKGFQAHENSRINLSPFLTVITGPNDSGKTAFQMAIRWVAEGEPDGDEFLLHFEDKVTGQTIKQAEEVTVGITMDDGSRVIKKRRKGKTMHRIERPGCEPVEYVKADVPEEVVELLGIKKKTFGETTLDLNFQYQHDACFLISEVPSVGAKVLGKLAKAESIDLAIAAETKAQFAARQAISESAKAIEQYTEQLKIYMDLDAKLLQLEEAEAAFADAEKFIAQVTKLRAIFSRWEEATNIIAAKNSRRQYLEEVIKYSEPIAIIEAQYGKRVTLTDMAQRYKVTDEMLDKTEHIIRRTDSVTGLYEVVVEVEAAVRRADRLHMANSSYQIVMERYNKTAAIVQATEGTGELGAELSMIESMDSRRDKLVALNVQRDKRFFALAEVKTYLESLPDTGALLASLDDLSQVTARRELLRSIGMGYDAKVAYAKIKNNDVTKAREEEQISRKDLEELWASTGGICPTCEQPLKQGKCNNAHL
jgi:exonuclease SbcC